jgi:hypothetical protein
MPHRSRSAHHLLSIKAAELAVAVPQVIALRMARLAAAGLSPTERDRNEFRRMSTEKTAAFVESWNAMSLQAFRANQALGLSFLRGFYWPWLEGGLSVTAASKRLHRAALGVLDKGLDPVHRRAVANAKRLTGAHRR